MSTNPLPEPLDDFLSRPPHLPADGALQESLFRKTALVRPQARRWPIAATVAAGVLLTLVVSYVVYRAGHDVVMPSRSDEQQRKIAGADTAKAKHDQETGPAPVLTAAQPQDLEWRAFDASDDHERARLYFQAGDLYLGEDQDIDGALRCYRQALACSDARELRFDPTDNWLVMALKNDLRKEP
jgi:hypothetical protein